MLLKSLFDTEPAAVPTSTAAPVAGPAAASAIPPAPAAPGGQSAHESADTLSHAEPSAPPHTPVPLLDGIDALGEIVLTLDAQLRAERATHSALCQRLHGELGALRRTLR
ncbi:hypothetical protein [Paraburkholderia sp.]|uniref:hypothetical protein n=1 Tax=Paraburkholderia sp. TaxID=1926495 RepID=UPI00286F9410|nr:hypothetical protein [Paraburkholderia sp.]